MENIIIAIASFVGICMVGWVSMNAYRYKQLYKYVKKGDKVGYFLGEERFDGTFKYADDKYAYLETIYGDKTVLLSDLYPLLGVDYKK